MYIRLAFFGNKNQVELPKPGVFLTIFLSVFGKKLEFFSNSLSFYLIPLVFLVFFLYTNMCTNNLTKRVLKLATNLQLRSWIEKLLDFSVMIFWILIKSSWHKLEFFRKFPWVFFSLQPDVHSFQFIIINKNKWAVSMVAWTAVAAWLKRKNPSRC